MILFSYYFSYYTLVYLSTHCGCSCLNHRRNKNIYWNKCLHLKCFVFTLTPVETKIAVFQMSTQKLKKCNGLKCKYFLWYLWCKNWRVFELPHCSGQSHVCTTSKVISRVLEARELKSPSILSLSVTAPALRGHTFVCQTPRSCVNISTAPWTEKQVNCKLVLYWGKQLEGLAGNALSKING